MNCLIVDDNLISRSVMKQFVSRDSELTLFGECDNAIDAYQRIMSEQIDLLFLDIEMDHMTGIELVKSLGQKKPIIIFTTSKREYAAEAYELNVADYMTKPVTLSRFLIAVEKAKEIYKSTQQVVKIDDDSFIFIRDSNIIRKLKIDEILFIEAMGDYVKLYTATGFYSVHSPLKNVESKLPGSRFIRVHRSFIIQLSKIDTIEGSTLIINHKMVPVADTYRAALSRLLKVL